MDCTVTKDVPKVDVTDLREWYRVELMQLFLANEHIVRADVTVYPFSRSLF